MLVFLFIFIQTSAVRVSIFVLMRRVESVCCLMEGEAVSDLNLFPFFFDDIFPVISLKIKDMFLKVLRRQYL